MDLLFFKSGVDTPHVYMCPWVLRCFHSPISTQTFGRVLTALMDINEREKCHFSGVAVLAEWGGRCWQSWEEGAGRVGRKVLAEWGGRCWQSGEEGAGRVGRKVLESDAWSVEQ